MSATKKKGITSKTWIAMLGTIVVAAFPALFMYFKNAGEAHFGDVVPTMLAFIGVGLLLFAIAQLVTRKPSKAGLITFLFLIALLNYTIIERLIVKIFPDLRYWHVVPILIVLLLHISWAIWRFVPDDMAEIITPVLSGVFAFLIAFNGISAVPSMLTRISAEKEAEKRAGQEVTVAEDMPNFYFILFDEFASIPFMQKNMNYDNSELLEKLEKLGFNNSQTGHNDSIWTSQVTANLFQLDYLGDYYRDSSEALFRLRAENPVFEQLRAAGYTIVSPAGAATYGLTDALGKKAKASTIGGEDLQTLLLQNTVIYPAIVQSSIGQAQVILEQIAYLKNKEVFPESNQFTLAHIICPHTPFIFGADGSINEVYTNSWNDLSMYVHQYQFISTQLYEIAESIVQNDPNAIVWILSDHSARPQDDKDFLFSNEDMRSFFSTVYYQGEKIDIEGLSGVNTFRVLLNKLLGTEYEMIPLP